MSQGVRLRAVVGIVLALYLAWGAGFIARTSFDSPDGRVFCLWDDAMISMQYARNLAEGNGLVWNAGGDRVQGISNPAVTFVMAGLHLLPFGDRSISLGFQLLNLLVLALALVCTFRLARTLVPGRASVWIGALLATALSGPLAVWALRGSDMGFVTLWLLLGVQGIARAETGQPGRLALRLALLGPGLLMRPDVALFYGLLIVAALRLGDRKAAVVGAAVAAVVIGGWMVAALVYYGDPLPNTYYLKATGHPRAAVLSKGIELIGLWVPYLLVPFGLAAAAIWTNRLRPTYLLCGAIIVASLGYSLWVGGDWMAGHGIRYMVPMLPLLAILMVEGAARAIDGLELGGAPGNRRAAIATVLVAGVLGALANPPAARAEWLGGQAPELLPYNRGNYFFALYVARHTDPSTSLGVRWAGAPIYFSRRPGVDFLGKSEPHIARLVVDDFRPGHSKWDWDHVLTRLHPDILTDDSLGLGERDDFRRDYVRVEKGDRHFYMRRGSLAKLHDPSVRLIDLETGRPTTRAQADEAPR